MEKAKEKGRRDRETLLKGWRRGGHESEKRGEEGLLIGRRDEKGGERRFLSHWESEKREKKGSHWRGDEKGGWKRVFSHWGKRNKEKRKGSLGRREEKRGGGGSGDGGRGGGGGGGGGDGDGDGDDGGGRDGCGFPLTTALSSPKRDIT